MPSRSRNPITINGNVVKVGFTNYIYYLFMCCCRVGRDCIVCGVDTLHGINECNKWPICLHHQRLSVCQALSRSLNILNIYYFYDSSDACVCVRGVIRVFRRTCSSHTIPIRRVQYALHIHFPHSWMDV